MPETSYFVGRKEELKSLTQLLNKKMASLVVIKGRRRIGKSRLAEEFARNKTFYCFTGLPPDKNTTAQSQRDEFARQLAEQFRLPALKGDDWGDLLSFLAQNSQKDRVVILLDEISWMGSKDPTFLGKLKIAWDIYFKKNPKLVLILCGSVSSWIEKNIISNTAFFGRISLKITLNELPLNECNMLLKKIGFRGSEQEKFILLGIIGGVPWYIELLNPGLSANENIKKLFFEPDGILLDEFKNIFHDLFGRRGKIYQRIVEILAKGAVEYLELADKLHYRSSGSLSAYLEDLVNSGYVSRDYTWSLYDGTASKLCQFRLKDNYLRFYLKYVASHYGQIKKGQFKETAITAFPGWESIMGLQFEHLVLNNRKLIHQALGIRPEDILSDNPFFQHKTTAQSGCQIDYLIHTKLGTLYVCEIKFSRKILMSRVRKEMEEKIKSLKKPKGFSYIPVLIYMNHTSDTLEENDYFGKVINFADLLAEAV